MTRHLTLAVALTVAAVVLAACGASGTSGVPSRTGELSAMGMPVVDTPGRAHGSVTASGVELTPEHWTMGDVPLLVAVRPVWTVANTGTQPFTVGQPHAEVREGCCPGAFTLQGPATVQPGGETRFTFELSMHPGMDGPHDMAVHVPVVHADGTTATLTANVTGDFHD